ncbi:hypothetical protein FRC09_016584 [Ceratobasidium sp. 395]|nr:hypothetical protein FRC09_016584 [Ceratobasidium sp. 395]
MARQGMFARASRRAALTLKSLPPKRGLSVNHLGHLSFTCPYCSTTLDSKLKRDRHVLVQPDCHARRLRELKGYVSNHLKKKRRREARAASANGNIPSTKRPRSGSIAEDVRPAKRSRNDDHCCSEYSTLPAQPPYHEKTSNPTSSQSIHGGSKHGTDSAQTSSSPFVVKFPNPNAGAPISDEKRGRPLTKEDLRDYLASCGPLGDPEKFEAAELLMTTGLTGKSRTRYLKSVLCKGRKLWSNDAALLKAIDRLPYGPEWIDQKISVGEGIHRRTHILYRRNIIEVVADLIGDARFKDCMKYAPEQHWTSSDRKTRVYGEMSSGNWWWRMQFLIRDPNGTVVPLIIASDKTQLSTMSGGQQAYPVYITIGNISKSVRRKASKRATVILGYLPVDRCKDIADKNLRRKIRGELLHRSLEAIMEPLKSASKDGVPMWCADGRLRRVYLILAAYVGDWPEQNDVCCTVQSGCPVCQQPFDGRGSGRRDVPLRDHATMAAAFQRYKDSGNAAELKRSKLRPCVPFWLDLPHVDFPSCITPDILHQLHKGIFKDYVAVWTEDLLGEKTLDARFMAMPQAKDLRHFNKGITNVSQWTGRETKEMAKQFLPIIADDPNVPGEFVELVRALLDFLYLAQSAELTEVELTQMDEALDSFHRLKKVLVDKELMLDLDKFDHIPKFHMLGHYTHSTRELGTPDGYNTESPEHLHIVYVKRGWRASNHRQAIKQIVAYIRRLEAIRIHRAYMDQYHCQGFRPRVDDEGECDDFDEGLSDDGGDNEVSRVEVDGVEDESEIAYPQPAISVAVQPTFPGLTGHRLVDGYGATDLIRSVGNFVKPLARKAGVKPVILPSDKFDTWHKITLRHRPLPFAPNEPLHQDVIRIRPPEPDEDGHQAPGLFDTAMFLNRPEAMGLNRKFDTLVLFALF